MGDEPAVQLPTVAPLPGVLYTPEQASVFLGGIGAKALLRGAQEGALQYTRVRGKIFFTLEDFQAIIRDGQVPVEGARAPRVSQRRRRTAPPVAAPPGFKTLEAKVSPRQRKAS